VDLQIFRGAWNFINVTIEAFKAFQKHVRRFVEARVGPARFFIL